MAHDAEALAYRWHLEAIQTGETGGRVDDLVDRNIVIHANGQEVHGVEGARQLARALRAAFPDIRFMHHEAIVSGDRVAIRWTADATHQGEYFGMPPSGKQVHFEGVDIFHIQDGRITQMWMSYDNLGPLQQAGILP